MPITAVLQTHVLVASLFLLLFTVKAVLLLLNRNEALGRIKSSTRRLDILFGTLILLTGGYLVALYSGGPPDWLFSKLVLVLFAVPVGIFSIDRKNKTLVALTFFMFLYIFGAARIKNLTLLTQEPLTGDFASPATDAAETGDTTLSESVVTHNKIISSMHESTLANAKAVYGKLCASCHGPDGTKGIGGAADLTISQLGLNDRMNVIAKGRGLMPGFDSQLNEHEVEALAAYTLTLKN